MNLDRARRAAAPARLLPPALVASLGVAWVVVLGGCAPGRSAPTTTVRDSAGVSIVENEAPDTTRLPVWHASGPVFDVGKLDGSDAETLFQVIDARRLSDGRVAVANAGTSEIRFYGPDGTHRSTVGGEGGGPGEFQRIRRIVLMPGDSLAVMDSNARRLSVLAPDGEFAREIPTGTSGAMLEVVGRRPDGAWMATQNRIISPDGSISEGLQRGEMQWVMIPAGGGDPDTLVAFRGPERVMQIGRSGGQITSISITSPPFGRTTTVVPRGDELLVATRDAAQLELYGPDGALRRIVRTGVALRPTTPELVEAFLERRYADFPPERRRDALKAARNMPAGEVVPPYGSVTVDRGGRIWVQDFAGLSDDNLWTVYAADGAAEARIPLPARFTPYDIGEDWILGKELDELEVEHVRIYGLERP